MNQWRIINSVTEKIIKNKLWLKLITITLNEIIKSRFNLSKYKWLQLIAEFDQ